MPNLWPPTLDQTGLMYIAFLPIPAVQDNTYAYNSSANNVINYTIRMSSALYWRDFWKDEFIYVY